MKDISKMSVSEISFKIFGSIAVIIIALLLLAWFSGIWSLLVNFILILCFVGGVALVIGIIFSIWEAE